MVKVIGAEDAAVSKGLLYAARGSLVPIYSKALR